MFQHAGGKIEHIAHGKGFPQKVLEAGAQVHEAAAFGVDGKAVFGSDPYGLPEGEVGLECCGMDLGVAAADVEGVHLGKSRVL